MARSATRRAKTFALTDGPASGLRVDSITDDQYRPWLESIFTAFGEDLQDVDVEHMRAVLDNRRCLAAFDGERIVGGAAAYAFSLTVPGARQLPAAGVTLVGVMPTHRRRGILRQMMARQLSDSRAAGDALAILWASEGVIYQRFGYGLASLNGAINIERSKAVFRRPQPPSGEVRLIDSAEAGRLYPQVYAAVAAQVPGFYARDDSWWQHMVLPDPPHWRRGAGRKHFVVHERDGRPTGYAVYRIKEEWGDRGPKSELRVQDVQAVDPAAERDVWQYLFGVDLIGTITRGLGPPDSPLLLQLEQPGLLGLRIGDGLWLRLLDVPAALAGRGYAQDGQVVLEVSDEFMPDVGGRFRLAVKDGTGRAERTSAEAELALEANDLASVYLGGLTFAQLARAGRTRELRTGAGARADRMLASPVQPWCPQVF